MTRLLVLVLLMMSLLAVDARGQGFFEDFDDGNDDGWLRFASLLDGAEPVWLFDEGWYTLGSNVPLRNRGVFQFVGSEFEASAGDPAYRDGTFSATVRPETPVSSALVAMRHDDSTTTAVYFAMNISQQIVGIDIYVGGTPVDRLFVPMEINPGQAYRVEASCGPGDVYRAWFYELPGDRPDEPTVELRSGADLPDSGLALIAYYGDPRVHLLRTSFDDAAFEPFDIGYCEVDLNGDGEVNGADFLVFLALYFDEDPRVDFNNDGRVDGADFLVFLSLYFAGC